MEEEVETPDVVRETEPNNMQPAAAEHMDTERELIKKLERRSLVIL